jgi:hypothetical protein
MAYPPTPLSADKADATVCLTDHSGHHNAIANAINDIVTFLGNSAASITLPANVGITLSGTAVISGVTCTLSGTTDSTTKDTGCLVVEGGIGVEKQVCVGTNLLVLGTTDSTTKDTGCVIVEGGIGVEKTLVTGGKVLVKDTTETTSSTTGCAILDGGLGIAKALAVGSLTASTFAYANANKVLTSLANADGVLYNNGTGTFSYKAIGVAAGNVAAGDHNHTGVYEASGAIATHAALTTGVHGLGTMSQQNANAVAIIGGSGAFTAGLSYKQETSGTISFVTENLEAGIATVAEQRVINGTVYALIAARSSASTDALFGLSSAGVAHLGADGVSLAALAIGPLTEVPVRVGINTKVVTSWSSGTLASGVFNVAYTLDATNSTTAATTLSGGLGVAKQACIGTNLLVAGTTDATTKDTGCVIIEGGIGIEKQACVGTNLLVLGTTDSTTKDTGCVIVEGGIGVEKQVCVGTNLLIKGTTEASSPTAGCAILDGGLGVAKNAWIGGKVRVESTIDSTGVTGTVGSFASLGGGSFAKQLHAPNLRELAKGLFIEAVKTLLTDDALKLFLIFDETGATTTIVDRSVNGHDATLGGDASGLTPQIAGMCPNLLLAAASATSWTVASHADHSHAGTPFSAVVLAAPTDITSRYLIAKHDATGNNREWYLYLDADGMLAMRLFEAATTDRVGRKGTVAVDDDGLWHVYAGTSAGGSPETHDSLKTYYEGIRNDGASDDNGTYSGMTPGPALVCPSINDTSGWFLGRMGVVIETNTEISAADMLRLSNLMRGYAGIDI